jgi:YHS domain-containing protein
MSAPTEKDPVCGMIDPANSQSSLSSNGKTYHFCSEKCLAAFKSQPSHYLAELSEPHDRQVLTEHEKVAGVSATIEFTCPMHPEIVRPAPGNCRICGMALEPRMSATT